MQLADLIVDENLQFDLIDGEIVFLPVMRRGIFSCFYWAMYMFSTEPGASPFANMGRRHVRPARSAGAWRLAGYGGGAWSDQPESLSGAGFI